MVGGLAIALALYVLAAGPAVRYDYFHDDGFNDLLHGIYRPLHMLADVCEPFANALRWYLKLWSPW